LEVFVTAPFYTSLAHIGDRQLRTGTTQLDDHSV